MEDNKHYMVGTCTAFPQEYIGYIPTRQEKDKTRATMGFSRTIVPPTIVSS